MESAAFLRRPVATGHLCRWLDCWRRPKALPRQAARSYERQARQTVNRSKWLGRAGLRFYWNTSSGSQRRWKARGESQPTGYDRLASNASASLSMLMAERRTSSMFCFSYPQCSKHIRGASPAICDGAEIRPKKERAKRKAANRAAKFLGVQCGVVLVVGRLRRISGRILHIACKVVC
jgi:hypothetical protein